MSPPSPLLTLGPPGEDLLIGAVIAERYRLLEKIGEGGMGVVYRAEHTLMRKPLAVKLLLPELGRLEQAVKRFEREAQAASRLSHEHIVQVTDFGRMESGALYLVMELVRGVPLDELIRVQGRLPEERALRLTRQILAALDHAHGQGVIHRDLKPENIILVRRGGAAEKSDFIKVLDFGLAKLKDDSSYQDPTKLSQIGIVFGTPDYMSPEQASGLEVDSRADLYACGIILFEMLTGKKPFTAERPLDVLAMQRVRPPPSLRLSAPDAGLSLRLEAVVLRALEKDRDRRFASAGAFLSALDGGSGAGAALAPTLSALPLVRARSWGRVRRLWTGARAVRRRVAAVWQAPAFHSARLHMQLWWDRRPLAVQRLALGGAVALIVLCGVVLVLARGPSQDPAAPAVAAPAAQAPEHVPDLGRYVTPAASLSIEDGDEVARYLRQLSAGESCADRREAVVRLGELRDRRALKALRRARSRKGFAGLHECMTRAEINQAIQGIEAD